MMLISAAVGGAFDQRWALTALVIGVFSFVFLAGWWAAPAAGQSLIVVAIMSVGASLTLVAGVVAISSLAEHTIPKEDSPTTIVTTSMVPATAPSTTAD